MFFLAYTGISCGDKKHRGLRGSELKLTHARIWETSNSVMKRHTPRQVTLDERKKSPAAAPKTKESAATQEGRLIILKQRLALTCISIPHNHDLSCS